jgi:hypothetical protein
MSWWKKRFARYRVPSNSAGRISLSMNRRIFLSIASALPARVCAWAGTEKPKQIYLIRHGEKNGDKNDIHLNARGFERAAALARLFPNVLDTPEFLFASKQSLHSNRPVETITPLGRALGLPINDDFANESYGALAKELLAHYGGKTVLVCWHHGNLPGFAAALGVTELRVWPETQFDRVWRLRYSAAGVTSFDDLPQRLLSRDS